MTVLEVIQAIQKSMSKAHDGATEADGTRVKIGLQREHGDFIKDKRVMDGFSIQFVGTHLIIKYHSEVNIEDVKDYNFSRKIEDTIDNICLFLSTEFRASVGKKLNLKKVGDLTIDVFSMNRRRSWVECACEYEIKNIDKPKENDEKEK